MAYSYFKDLSRKTASDKVLRDKAFNIAKSPKYDGYREDKKLSGTNTSATRLNKFAGCAENYVKS